MKKAKRLLAYMLSIAMVFSYFVGIDLTAKASASADTAVEIAVGDTQEVAINTPGESYWVKFTPTEEGEYVFYSQGGLDTKARLYDVEKNELTSDDDGMGDNNFKLVYSLTAGDVYYLESFFYYPEQVGSFSLHLEKSTKATSISFIEDTYTGFVGYTVGFEFDFTPIYTVDTLTYSVDKEGIIEIDTESNEAKLLAPGTVTVTVETTNGCTDTCTITVREVKNISDGETGTVEAVNRDRDKYEVTVKEDGTYMLYSEDCSSAYFYLYTDEETIDSDYDGDACVLIANLKAGETYECSCYNNGSEPYTIHLQKIVNATSISVSEDAIEGYPGDEFYLEVERTPIYSVEEYEWTSSDETVATVNEDGEVILKKEGNATITVKTERGLTDTCKVTVKAIPTISLDTKTTVTLEDSDKMMSYVFTPTTSGTYGFYSDTTKDVYGYIYTEAGEMVAYDDDSGEDYNFLIEAELEAGKTYYLKTGSYSSGMASYDVYVTKLKAATEMSFEYSTLTGYVGETKWVDVTFGPGFVKSEGWALSSTNEEIACIDEDGDIKLLKVGTTTIVATSENGLTCKCTITVKNPEVLSLDKEMTVQLQEDQNRVYFNFTPEENGTYAFYSTDDNNGYCYLYDEHDEHEDLTSNAGSGIGDNFKIVYDLEAGKTYTYVCINNYDSVSVKLQKAEEVTGIAISRDSVKGYVGDNTSIELDILPINSDSENIEGQVTWTSSNPDIVEIGRIWSLENMDCSLNFKATGTATVTAEWNGYKATCEVTVVEIPEIKVNDIKTVRIENKHDYEMYEFTPEKDGTYVFSTNASAPVWVQVSDSEFNYLDYYEGDTKEPNASLELRLKAGETYYFAVGSDSNKTGAFTVALIDKDNPPVVTPDNPSDNTDQTTNSPKTGDNQVAWTWIILMMAAAVTGYGVVVYRKKENE